MRPRLLDLFCCAGGAAVGYRRAGFDVYGVDIVPSPRYPFPIHVGDALGVLDLLLAGVAVDFTHLTGEVEWLTIEDFLAEHASPPCQLYSITKHTHTTEHPDLVEPTRQALDASGLPWVMENVEGAPLLSPLTLCGSEFGLRARDVDGVWVSLKRHRLFESNRWLMGAGGCSHGDDPVAGVYTGSRHRKPEHRDSPDRRGGYTPARSVRAELMEIDWMNDHELAQAIPPAYTEFIGKQLIQQLVTV